MAPPADPLHSIELSLAAPGGVFAAEGPVLDLGDELAAAAFVQDYQTAVRDDDAQAGSVEGAGEHHPLGGFDGGHRNSATGANMMTLKGDTRDNRARFVTLAEIPP
jgi:hypothetical protein